MSRSLDLYSEARSLFPGGVNSPVRALVKPYPFYVERAEGAYVYTVDGEELIDMVLAYGPLILGHKHPRVLEKVQDQIFKGWLYGAPAEVEVRLAKKILQYVMKGGMVRFVNSGSEATMLALRLARAFTRRKFIVKFDGCYHGAHDYMLVSAGSAAEHYGVPSSDGVPEEVARLTLVANFNDFDGVERLLRAEGERVSAIIVEPVMGNMGVIPPKPGFLKHLRELSDRYGSLLIFDEVITGFRLGLGGAQEHFNVKADIVVLGKIIGGGFPIGAVVARRDIMENVTPQGRVFNAGTFNAHPLSMSGGLATIEVLEEGETYSVAARAAKTIAKALEEASMETGIQVQVNIVESMLQAFFTANPVVDAATARLSNKILYERFHEEMRRRGVFIAPSQFEAIFTGLPHRGPVLDKIVDAIHGSFKALKGAVG
ncbi:MAG: glutamate-1-semialdehyde 2,1-aminomutase [Thermoprotei archaeon]|nr:glutamate-1-semialdehyde 2,1-aminomutase [Thermoprotei archaeon]